MARPQLSKRKIMARQGTMWWRLNSYIYPFSLLIYSMCECVTIFGFSRFTLLYFFLNFFRMSHTPSFWVSLLGLPRQYFFFFLGWSFNYVWAIHLLVLVPKLISLFWALCKCFIYLMCNYIWFLNIHPTLFFSYGSYSFFLGQSFRSA